MQLLVVAGLERQPVERPPVLDRHRCLGPERGEQVDVGGGGLAPTAVEEREGAVDLAGLARERDRHHGLEPFAAHRRDDRRRKRDRRVLLQQRGHDRPPLGDGHSGGAPAERHLQARGQPIADRAGVTHRDQQALGLVEAEQDRAVGAGDGQRLGHDGPRDLGEIQAAHEGLPRPMEDVEVSLARARLPVEPHLLAQQPDEDDADAERPRESRQVPRDAVAVGADQHPDQSEHPDVGGEEEVAAEGVSREVATQAAPQRPRAGGGADEDARPEAEGREPPGHPDHGGQERTDLEHDDNDDRAEHDDAGADPEPAAVPQRQAALARMRGQADARQSGQVAEEEEVRRDARVDAGIRRIVGLGGDVGEREQRRQPQRAAHAGRAHVLAQAMALEAEIADAGRHQGERRVEDRHGVRDWNAQRQAARAQQHGALVKGSQDEAENDRDPRRDAPSHRAPPSAAAPSRATSRRTISGAMHRGNHASPTATAPTALPRNA